VNKAPPGRLLRRSFFARPAFEVAPELLNKVLVVGRAGGGEAWRAGRIVEVEAYGGSDDPASHAYRGESRRNRTMFGPPGHLYVYRSYGMHWCANVVTGAAGQGQAVLLRALAPIVRSAADPDEDASCRGPARLTRTLGIAGADDGADLTRRSGALVVLDDGVPPPGEPAVGVRVGVSVATEKLWRWWVPGERAVSAWRPGRAPRNRRG